MSVFMNPLPPQAYTKDTLVQAYAWLQSQSDSVKELATNPDILVSLFMKSKTQGDQFFERPSIQNFKNELKNLAGMIGEFEQTPAQMSSPALSSSSPSGPIMNTNTSSMANPSMNTNINSNMSSLTSAINNSSQNFNNSSSPSSIFSSAPPPQAMLHQQTFQSNATAPYPSPMGTTSQQGPGSDSHLGSGIMQGVNRSSELVVDEKSIEMIREVKKSLNLTSESEVLRLLLSIGYQKARQLYK